MHKCPGRVWRFISPVQEVRFFRSFKIGCAITVVQMSLSQSKHTYLLHVLLLILSSYPKTQSTLKKQLTSYKMPVFVTFRMLAVRTSVRLLYGYILYKINRQLPLNETYFSYHPNLFAFALICFSEGSGSYCYRFLSRN